MPLDYLPQGNTQMSQDSSKPTQRFFSHLPQNPDYLAVLNALHLSLLPRTYVEIGVALGRSLSLALDETTSIGIDPCPYPIFPLSRNTTIFCMESHDDQLPPMIHNALAHRPIDFAFIDGMHLFEYALHDFILLESLAASRSIITLHDCLPPTPESAQRRRVSRLWCGDTWKLILCLRSYRPDLSVTVLDVPPSGLAIITNLNPNSEILRRGSAEILQRYTDITYEERYLSPVHPTSMNLVNLVSTSFQPDTSPAIEDRERRRMTVQTLLRKARVYAARRHLVKPPKAIASEIRGPRP